MGSERIAVAHDAGVAHVELAREDKFNAMDGDVRRASARRSGRSAPIPRCARSCSPARGRHFTAGLDLHYAGSQFPPSDDPGRAAEARLRHIQWLQDCFSAVEQARRAGDRGDPRRLHRRRSRSRHRLRHPHRRGRRLLPGRRGRRRDHRRSRHAPAPHPSHPRGHRPRARLYRPADGAPRKRRGSASPTASSPTARRRSPPALDLARTIAAKSPLAVAGAKMSLNYSRGRTVEEGLRHVALWNAAALGQRRPRRPRSRRGSPRRSRGSTRSPIDQPPIRSRTSSSAVRRFRPLTRRMKAGSTPWVRIRTISSAERLV